MILVIMGVSGAGKTTVGQLLAEQLDWPFFDADDFHPAENIAKMSDGIPLADADRLPWLQNLRDEMRAHHAAGNNAILACSALKESYRRTLAEIGDFVQFVYLKGDPEIIRDRLSSRTGHFMKENLLATQFAALEEPAGGLIVSIDAPPEEIAASIRQALAL